MLLEDVVDSADKAGDVCPGVSTGSEMIGIRNRESSDMSRFRNCVSKFSSSMRWGLGRRALLDGSVESLAVGSSCEKAIDPPDPKWS